MMIEQVAWINEQTNQLINQPHLSYTTNDAEVTHCSFKGLFSSGIMVVANEYSYRGVYKHG